MEWFNTVAILITAFAAIFAGTYFTKFKLLVKEVKELVDRVHVAIADDEITAQELKDIVKEAMDVVKVFVKK